MPRPQGMAQRHLLSRPRWCAWLPAGALMLLMLATLAGGVLSFWTRAELTTHNVIASRAVSGISAVSDNGILATVAVILLLCALAQGRLAWLGWKNGRLISVENPLAQMQFWKALIVSGFLTYLGALLIGPVANMAWAWLASVAVLYSLLLLPLAASGDTLETWRKWSQARVPRQIGWLVVTSIALLVGSEAALRAYRQIDQRGWLTRAVEPAAQPEALADPTVAADQDDLQLTFFHPGPFRVAILGDEQTLNGARQNGCISRVQQMLPGVRLLPVVVDVTTSRQAAQRLTAALREAQADLALYVIGACDDPAPAQQSASIFDWRGLELAQSLGVEPATTMPVAAATQVTSQDETFEGHLETLVPQLAACRTPVDAQMNAHWQQRAASLEVLRACCGKIQVPLALVVVPGQFQVSRPMCEALVRRSGVRVDQYDFELPQRRLASFAERRQLPVLDLLPHLRMCRQPMYEHNRSVWNEQGHAAAAAAIGGWLQSSYGGQLAMAELTSTK